MRVGKVRDGQLSHPPQPVRYKGGKMSGRRQATLGPGSELAVHFKVAVTLQLYHTGRTRNKTLNEPIQLP